MNSDKLISDIDTEHLKGIANRLSVSESNRKVKTIDYLLNSLEIETRHLSCIKSRKKENQGNLSEKIEKTFIDKPILAKPYILILLLISLG